MHSGCLEIGIRSFYRTMPWVRSAEEPFLEVGARTVRKSTSAELSYDLNQMPASRLNSHFRLLITFGCRMVDPGAGI